MFILSSCSILRTLYILINAHNNPLGQEQLLSPLYRWRAQGYTATKWWKWVSIHTFWLQSYCWHTHCTDCTWGEQERNQPLEPPRSFSKGIYIMNIYLFVLGLSCGTQDLPCITGDLSLRRMDSSCGTWAPECESFDSCRVWAQELRLRDSGACRLQ